MKNRIGQLKHGLKVGDAVQKEFEIRPMTTGDLYDAEDMAPPDKSIKFAHSLLCCQLVRIGTFNGPFTLDVMRKIKPSDIGLMQEVRLAMAEEGEGEQLDAASG